jgi:hypothetical protein
MFGGSKGGRNLFLVLENLLLAIQKQRVIIVTGGN